jgi:hypothetical protein
MIRIDAVWLATEPMDMRAGTDTALARVVGVFGAAHPHTAYLFANRRANRMKVLVHDGIGIWLAARRLHQGHFVWPQTSLASAPSGLDTGLALVAHWGGRHYYRGVITRLRGVFASIGGCVNRHSPEARAHLRSWLSSPNYCPI